MTALPALENVTLPERARQRDQLRVRALFADRVGVDHALHRLVAVELVDEREQLGLRRAGRQAMLEALHAGGARRLALGTDVDLARGIVAHQHHRQPRRAGGPRDEAGTRGGDALAQGQRERLAVDDRGGHA